MYTLHSIFLPTTGALPLSSSVCVPPRTDRHYVPDDSQFGRLASVSALQARYRAAGYVRGHHIGMQIDDHPQFLVQWLALSAHRRIDHADQCCVSRVMHMMRCADIGILRCGSRKRRQPSTVRSAIRRCCAPRPHHSGGRRHLCGSGWPGSRGQAVLDFCARALGYGKRLARTIYVDAPPMKPTTDPEAHASTSQDPASWSSTSGLSSTTKK